MKKEDIKTVERADSALLEARQRGKISIAEQILFHNLITSNLDKPSDIYFVRCDKCNNIVVTTSKYIKILEKCPKCGETTTSENVDEFVKRTSKPDIIHQDEASDHVNRKI